MSQFVFTEASRASVPFKMAIQGPSGSGKTFSALLIAQGIQEEAKKLFGVDLRIAYIDTENGSASLYAGAKDPSGNPLPKFYAVNLKPPYTTDRYLQAMNAAVAAGFGILIVDSFSHQWFGEGGILQRKELLDARPGSNSWANWSKFTPEHELMKSWILNSPIHMIACMRSKQEYTQTEENGKKKIQKLGSAPIQRDGTEYEFTTVFDLAMNHDVEVSKDRTSVFDGLIFRPGRDTGRKIVQWLASGAPAVSPKAQAVQPQTPNPSQTAAPVETNSTQAPPIGAAAAWAQGQPTTVPLTPQFAPDPEPTKEQLAKTHFGQQPAQQGAVFDPGPSLHAAMKASKFNWTGRVSEYAKAKWGKTISQLTMDETKLVVSIIKSSEPSTAFAEITGGGGPEVQQGMLAGPGMDGDVP